MWWDGCEVRVSEAFPEIGSGVSWVHRVCPVLQGEGPGGMEGERRGGEVKCGGHLIGFRWKNTAGRAISSLAHTTPHDHATIKTIMEREGWTVHKHMPYVLLDYTHMHPSAVHDKPSQVVLRLCNVLLRCRCPIAIPFFFSKKRKENETWTEKGNNSCRQMRLFGFSVWMSEHGGSESGGTGPLLSTRKILKLYVKRGCVKEKVGVTVCAVNSVKHSEKNRCRVR